MSNKKIITDWYMNNKGVYKTDIDLLKELRVSIPYTSQIRRELIADGFTFYVKTSDFSGNVKFWYTLADKTNEGIVCMDEVQSACPDSYITDVLHRCTSNDTIELLELVRELNPIGYFSYKQIAETLNWDRQKVQRIFQKSCSHYHLKASAIGYRGDRKYRVVGRLKALEPVEKMGVTETEPVSEDLIYKVFR